MYLQYRSKYRGRPLIVFEAKLTICNNLEGTKNKNLYSTLTLLNLTTKTNTDFLIFSCIPNIGPKSLLEYRGRPMIVFEAKLTICNILVGTKNKNLRATLTFMNLTTKTILIFRFSHVSLIPVRNHFWSTGGFH